MTKTYELHLAFGVTMPVIWPVIILLTIIAFIIAYRRNP